MKNLIIIASTLFCLIPSAQAVGNYGVPPTGVSCPSSHPIKGNFTTYDGSRCIAHAPGGVSYNRTYPERCYANMQEAISDGCRPARR